MANLGNLSDFANDSLQNSALEENEISLKSLNDQDVKSCEIFENPDFGAVRACLIDGEPWFCLSDICRVLELHTGMTKQRLDQRGVSLIYTPTQNQHGAEVVQQMVFVNEKNLYKIIMRSDKPQAEPFQDWVCGDVLPSIRKTGKYSMKQEEESIRCKTAEDVMRVSLMVAQGLRDILHASDSSIAAYLNKASKMIGSPEIDYTSSKDVTFSASDLLKKFGRDESSQAFNKRMVEMGFLEVKTRSRSKGGEKSFKALTEAGLEFGVNLVSPKNEREVQPHYYEGTFGKLLSILFG